MNDIQNDLNEIKKFDPTLNYNIGDVIAKSIFEKILSLVITQSAKNNVERQIPHYCFNDIKQTLELAIFLDFLNHDRDDLNLPSKLNKYKSKSVKNISYKIKNKSFYYYNEDNSQTSINNMRKSLKIKKYKFNKYLDPNISFENTIYLELLKSPNKKKKKKENKINEENDMFMGILVKDESTEDLDKSIIGDIRNEEKLKKENDIPFIVNPSEGIENIQKIETHNFDYNHFYNNLKINSNYKEHQLLYDSIKEGSNNWGLISQPSAPPIDRDACTKIKYAQPFLFPNKKSSIINQNLIIKEEKEYNNKEKKKIKKSIILIKNENPKIIQKENIENIPKKKKYVQMIDFPSEDLDPKIYRRDSEGEEFKKLREDLEKEIAEKKLEIEKKLKKRQEELELKKALEERRKELANKKVTLDIKGELVYIKNIDVNALINDFTKGRSNFKDIKTIEDEFKAKPIKRRKSIYIEKNPDALKDYKTLENEKSPKRRHKNKNQIIPNRKVTIDGEKSLPQKNKNESVVSIMDKSKHPLDWAGSNFDLINPECGVNLTEDKKTKSGGKDYFRKYNKYSLQVFEETLSKTASSNFYQNKNNINNIDNGINVTNLKKSQIKEIIKEIDKKNINTNNVLMPSESNDKLLVKTKNLKLALNELDLISETEEKNLLDKKNNKNKQGNENIMKRKQYILDFRKNKHKNLNEINKFAKTLMSDGDWGNRNNVYEKKNNLKQTFRQPTKPIFDELKRELPVTILNHLPRKRLPPINVANRMKENNMGFTINDGFFNRKRRNKLRIMLKEENKNVQIETERNNINNNDNNTLETEENFNTSSNFYKNIII